jgi:hypothetical protein
MNDLHAWLSQPHHGFRTFQIFQQELETLSGDEPEQRALGCRRAASHKLFIPSLPPAELQSSGRYPKLM